MEPKIELIYLGDFIYYEGPLLSLFKDINNKNIYYLCKWVDVNSISNKWLYIEVNTITLKDFLLKKIQLRDIILFSENKFIVDLNNNLEEINKYIILNQDIPIKYLPLKNSYYNENSYTQFARDFKTELFLD